MDRAKKRRIKKYISWVCIAAVVVLLAAMPLMAKSGDQTDGPQASILSGTVQTRAIRTELHGGGTLAQEEGLELTIPSGVKLTEFLVKNGDAVAQGDALARVDRVSVMTAVTQVQETLDHLAEQMQEASEAEASGEVVTKHAGRVKLVCAEEGDSVETVMLEHGALAVLSLDGKMAVELTTDQGISTGDTVTVTLSDGTAVAGRVESALGGVCVITVEDEGYAVGEPVTVATESGAALGSGALYIHNAWKATAYSGVVEEVKIEPEDTVSADKTLFTLTDTDNSGDFAALAAQRREYEALMLELFRLYQDTTITAPCDGVVSGVDEDSIYLLGDSGEGWTLELLANAPNGDDETVYNNFIGMVTGVNAGVWNLVVSPQKVEITDYKLLTGIEIDPSAMTQVAGFVPGVPVYELVEGQWQQINAAGVAAGDTLLFAGNENGEFVWVVRLKAAAGKPEEPITPTEPTEPADPGVSTEPTDPSAPTEPSVPTEPADPTIPTIPSWDGQIPGSGALSGILGGSFGGMGGYTGGGAQTEDEFDLYDLERGTIAVVTPQNTVTLSIMLDERDVGKISLGQIAEVKVGALKNESFTARVTQISTTGTNNGGSSKFAVELTMERDKKMLAGMNATVSIVLSAVENVPAIPVAALVEQGSQTLVYTACNAETGELSAPVAVITGVSDGENAQILSGLETGAEFYYAYYDTLEISNEVESNGFSFGG